MTADLHVELGQEPFADRARRDPRRRFTRRRALENVACVVTIVLEQSGEIRVPGTDARHRAPSRREPASGAARRLARGQLFLARRRVHHVLPVLPVAILDAHRDGRTDRLSRSYTRQELDGVAFDLHASAAPIALLPSRELDIHVLGEQGQTGGHSFQHADECGSV